MRVPDLADLRLLVAVAEEGSLGAAARRLGVAQPNASRTLRRLEAQVGTPLVIRTPRGSRPTVEGELVVAWSRPLLAAAEGLVDGIESLHEHAPAPVEVAASMTIAEHLVPGWLIALRGSDPEAHVRLRVENSVDVVELVRAGAVDAGFIEDGTNPTGLSGCPVGTDHLLLVVAPDHRWARRTRTITIDDVARTPLVQRERGSGTRAVLEAALAPRELAEPALVGNSNAAVRAAIQAGVAPGVLSELVVADALQAGSLVEVPIHEVSLRRVLRAVWRFGQHPRGTVGRLVALAANEASERGD